MLTPDPLNTNFNTQKWRSARAPASNSKARPALTRGLDVVASYAYSDTEVTKASANARGVTTLGNRAAVRAGHQASLWMYYTFHDTLFQGLGLGAGVLRYIGRSYGDAANTYRVHSLPRCSTPR